MQLHVITPVNTVLDADISKITFESLIGLWTVLPKHRDFVTVVPSGIVRYAQGDTWHYVAIADGTLVKKEQTLTLSTPLAILSDSQEFLVKAIEQDFKKMEEERKKFNITMARLEVGLAKGLMTLKQEGEA